MIECNCNSKRNVFIVVAGRRGLFLRRIGGQNVIEASNSFHGHIRHQNKNYEKHEYDAHAREHKHQTLAEDIHLDLPFLKTHGLTLVNESVSKSILR